MAVGLHGTDVAIAGYNTMANGDSQDTLTSQGLQAVGVPQNWANGVDAGISIIGTIGSIPEPSSGVLLAIGVEIVRLRRRRKWT